MGEINSRKITFFSLSMDLTGSEVVLFNLLNYLDSSIEATVIITKYKGKLFDQLNKRIKKKAIHTVNSNSGIKNKIFRLLQKVIVFPFILSKYKASVWYVNTITQPEIIRYALKHKIKLIVHVHELEQIFAWLNKTELSQLIDQSDLIIANSQTTVNLLKNYKREKEVEICYPAIDTHKVIKDKHIYEEYREKLHIKPETFVWVMCGTLDKNKNPDLFIEIAAEIIKTSPNTMFLWIGGVNNTAFEESRRNKIDKLGLTNKIIWLGQQNADYYNYFNCADGFVLTSEKESFSLVTLEALLLGLPIVVQDCGGVKEILGNDIGKIIEQNNSVILMAKAMIDYMTGEVKNDVKKGEERAAEFDIRIWAKKWNAILLNFLNTEA